ncbi:MAG: AAA family ATPase [Candidatus Binataceae bacterium]
MTPMPAATTERALAAAMMRPEFYPHPAARVELRQTHISRVFLAGDWVYKIKKPVRFGFVDCSTLERRLHFCREEVRLNARFSSEIYDGVYAIIAGANGFALGPRSGGEIPGAIEYAVRMRRLPDDRMLDRMVAAGAADSELIKRIAARIAAFHAAASAADAAKYGSALAAWETIVGNIAECEHNLGRTIEAGDFAALDRFCRSFILANWDAIGERARRGRVREGHGDLRCEHVCVRGGNIDIIDCVEFSERLRCADVASDLAFLAMDLDRLGAPRLAEELVNEYAKASGDGDIDSMLPLYKCHRAAVRGKVESLRAEEPEADADARARATELARRYFALALGYARDAEPAMLIVCGRSGSGKSTVARMLRRRTGFDILGSDRIRKRLAEIPAAVHSSAGYREGIYTDSFTRRTYAAMLDAARGLLRCGRGAILDATFKERRDRADALELAAQLNAPVLFVECVASGGETLRRLAIRVNTPGEVSDATPEVYRLQRADFVPITEIPASRHIVADTVRAAPEIMAEIAAARRRNETTALS